MGGERMKFMNVTWVDGIASQTGGNALPTRFAQHPEPGCDVERTEARSAYRRQVDPPPPQGIRFNMAGAVDRQPAKNGQIDGLRVQTTDMASSVNDQVHQLLPAALPPIE